MSLLRTFNFVDTRSEFWETTSTYLDLCGNSLWLKVRDFNTKRVIELWPLPAQWVTPWHTDRELLAGYLLAAPGGQVEIPRSDVIHFRTPNPVDRFWGLSTLGAAAEAMRASDAMKAAQLAAFDNDVISSMFFTTDQALNEDAWKRMMTVIRERYTGVRKAGTPTVLHGGLKPVPGTRSPSEMSFRESLSFTRDEILGIFGVPPLLAGVVENANNSNTASQERVFAKETVAPILVRIQERINKDLTPEFGPGLCVEFDDPSPADEQLKNTLTTRAYSAGIVTRNEARAELGYDAVADGDGFKEAAPSPANDTPAAAIENAAPTNSLSAARPSPGGNSGRRSAALHTRALLVRTIRRDQDKLIKKAAVPVRRFFEAQAERIRASVRRVFANLPQIDEPRAPVDIEARHYILSSPDGDARLYADGTVVIEAGSAERGVLGRIIPTPSRCLDAGQWRTCMVRAIADSALDDLDDWKDAADELADAMLPRLKESLKEGAARQNDQLNLDGALNLKSPEAMRFLRAKDRDYWNGTVNQTTRDLLGERLAAVLDGRPTIDELIAAVNEVMDGRIKSSAETIARTEVVGAYGGGSDIIRSQIGITKKEWIATNDDGTRQSHVDADGQVVSQDSEFEVGGERLAFPGDPSGPAAQICNCRCAAVAVIDDE